MHVRIVELHKRGKGISSMNGDSYTKWIFVVSGLSQPQESPVTAALESALSKLLPGDVSPATFNSQYLQRCGSSSPLATLAVARVLHMLSSPADEVETTVFSVLESERALDVPVRPLSLIRLCR